MELDRLCAEYLRSINPIAQRIAEDLENVENANREKWTEIGELARLEIIDKNLIDEELIEKYQDQVTDDSDLEPVSSFSWFTKSQLDLFTLINVKTSQSKSPVKKIDVLSPLKKGRDIVDAKQGGIINQIKLKVMKSPPPGDNRGDARLSKTLPKPRMPPPPPPPKRMSNSDNGAGLTGSSSQDDIPKTGFDFLDNW